MKTHQEIAASAAARVLDLLKSRGHVLIHPKYGSADVIPHDELAGFFLTALTEAGEADKWRAVADGLLAVAKDYRSWLRRNGKGEIAAQYQPAFSAYDAAMSGSTTEGKEFKP